MRTLLHKEWTDQVRSLRLLFVPLILMMLVLSNMVLMKMLPDLLESGTGNLPPGTVLRIPPPTALDAAIKMISQLDQLGVLTVILVLMGAIAGERASGVMTTLLIKPVSRTAYAGAKAAASFFLITASYGLAVGTGYWYQGILFDAPLPSAYYWTGCLVYFPKLLFVCVLVLFFSSLTRSSVAAGGLSLAALLTLSFASHAEALRERTPAAFTFLAEHAFQGQSVTAAFPLAVTLALTAILFVGTVAILSRRER